MTSSWISPGGDVALGRRRGRAPRALGLVAASLLAGCAHYTPSPLAKAAPLAADVSQLPGAGPPFDKRLTVPEVVALALRNNPGLRAVRARSAAAHAQRLQAGVLPNPALAGALLPLISGPGTVSAWNIALSQDVKALVAYRSRRRGAAYAAEQVDAEILWQEWQVAGQARQLAVDLIEGERSRPLLEEAFQLLSRRAALLQRALAAHDVTLVTAAPTLVALQSARTSVQTFEQRQLYLRHQLNALLSLQPDAVAPLAQEAQLPPFDPAAIRADLATLADRRPDLLALRLGYASQDEAVRTQILAQFPDLLLGGAVSSDNSRVVNGGPQVTVGLPVFNRNQGGVALANATRAQLNAEYAARLAAAVGEVGALLREMEQVSAQLAVVRRDLPAARLAADRAAAAFSASNLDERSFVDLLVNRFAKEQEVMALQLALLDRQVALQTLVGAGLPVAVPLAAASARASAR